MKKIFLSALLILIVFASSGLLINKVQAADIGPDKYYIDINSTKPITQKLTIYGNPAANVPVTEYLGVYGMRKVGEGDDREFYQPDPSDEGEIANWITLDKNQVTVGPHDIVEVNWTLTPKSLDKCGTNLAAIGVSEVQVPKNLSGSAIGVKFTTFSQIHLNIVGFNSTNCINNKTNLDLLEFKVNSVIPIFNYDNIPFLTRIQNNSNYIAKDPQGFIEIFGIGDKITIPFNSKNLDIYPGTVRRFDDLWLDPNYPHDGNFFEQTWYELTHLRIGEYQARLGITNHVTTQIVSGVTLWIIPWRVILLLIIIILILIAILIAKRRGKKENKKGKKIKSK